jgi:hypothetical protein
MATKFAGSIVVGAPLPIGAPDPEADGVTELGGGVVGAAAVDGPTEPWPWLACGGVGVGVPQAVTSRAITAMNGVAFAIALSSSAGSANPLSRQSPSHALDGGQSGTTRG